MKQRLDFVPISCMASSDDARLFNAIFEKARKELKLLNSKRRTETKPISENLVSTRCYFDFELSELPDLVAYLEAEAIDDDGELVNENAELWARDIRDLNEYPGPK